MQIEIEQMFVDIEIYLAYYNITEEERRRITRG